MRLVPPQDVKKERKKVRSVAVAATKLRLLRGDRFLLLLLTCGGRSREGLGRGRGGRNGRSGSARGGAVHNLYLLLWMSNGLWKEWKASIVYEYNIIHITI